MAEFTRKFLMDHGVPEDQVDAIMAARNQTMNDTLSGYVPKADVQKQIDAAIAAVPKPEPIDPKTTDEYMALQRERDMLRAIGGEDFASVKPKFREQVFGMLDRGEKAKPINEQLTGIQEKYEEFFTVNKQEPTPKPTFGAPTQGSMPKGDEGAEAQFLKAWGLTPKK
jgi:hypothetical protein